MLCLTEDYLCVTPLLFIAHTCCHRLGNMKEIHLPGQIIKSILLLEDSLVVFINLPSHHHQVWQTGGLRAMCSPSCS